MTHSWSTLGPLVVLLSVAIAGSSRGGLAHANEPLLAFSTPSHSATAPRVTESSPNYQSPAVGTTLQVREASGVANRPIVVRTDKGFLTSGWRSCPGGERVITGTTGTDGTFLLTFCADQADDPGVATLEAMDLGSHETATFAITVAGRPARAMASADGWTTTVTVSDKDGNRVADGTPVRFNVFQKAGDATSACELTRNGQAVLSAFSVALRGASGPVIVSAEWNEDGNPARCGAPGARSVRAAVTLPAAPTTPTPNPGEAKGAIPAGGGFGLIVYSGPVESLLAASGCPLSTAAFWTTVNGAFITYVPGSQVAAVNAGWWEHFGTTDIPAGTVILGRCR
jgi:hypothetical protein